MVAGYRDALAKVQADELTTEARGHVQERPANDWGERRRASAVGREATFRFSPLQRALLPSAAALAPCGLRAMDVRV